MNTQERETVYLYLSSMMIVLPTGYGVWTLFGMLPAISAMFVVGGFLVFLRTVLTLKIAELEFHLKPIVEGHE